MLGCGRVGRRSCGNKLRPPTAPQFLTKVGCSDVKDWCLIHWKMSLSELLTLAAKAVQFCSKIMVQSRNGSLK